MEIIKQAKEEFEKLKGAKLKKIVFQDYNNESEYGDEFEFKLFFDNGLILDLDTCNFYPSIDLYKEDAVLGADE